MKNNIRDYLTQNKIDFDYEIIKSIEETTELYTFDDVEVIGKVEFEYVNGNLKSVTKWDVENDTHEDIPFYYEFFKHCCPTSEVQIAKEVKDAIKDCSHAYIYNGEIRYLEIEKHDITIIDINENEWVSFVNIRGLTGEVLKNYAIRANDNITCAKKAIEKTKESMELCSKVDVEINKFQKFLDNLCNEEV